MVVVVLSIEEVLLHFKAFKLYYELTMDDEARNWIKKYAEESNMIFLE